MTIDKYLNKVYNCDCLELLKKLPDKCVDMILCDLPYGTTACKWDTIIPFDKLWEQYKRITKYNSAIVLTASQPFTSRLVCSNFEMFKYEWIYKKRCASNFAQAKYAPMKEHENILVFAKGKVNYNPIKEKRQGSGSDRAKYSYGKKSRHNTGEFVGKIKGNYDKKNDNGNDNLRFPSSIQEFNNRASGDRGFHPTQKPVALGEYLIKTYSNKSDIVLDNCCGSGSFIVACERLGRRWIGCEISPEYVAIANERIKTEQAQLKLPI